MLKREDELHTLLKCIDLHIKLCKNWWNLQHYLIPIFLSLAQMLETYKPILIIEILPTYNMKNKNRIKSQEQILSILKNLNYLIFRVLKSDSGFSGLKEIDDIEIHNDLELCDYVLVHKHFKENFYKEFNLSI